MSWRKHNNHKDETKAVRHALKTVGINAKVGHGSGTGWAWLKVNIGAGQQWGEHERVDNGHVGCVSTCTRCINLRIMHKQTRQIVRDVTGRHGEYDGDTNILTQDQWNESKGCSAPIEHPNWTPPRPVFS